MAVDCWYPHGSCRQDFSLPNYPRLFVYFARKLRFLEYIGGLRSYEIVRNILTTLLNVDINFPMFRHDL